MQLIYAHARSIVSILTGATALFLTGLFYGGPVAISWGWPLVSIMSFIVCLSMAEICSGTVAASMRVPIHPINRASHMNWLGTSCVKGSEVCPPLQSKPRTRRQVGTRIPLGRYLMIPEIALAGHPTADRSSACSLRG